jgi:hypothetical protein
MAAITGMVAGIPYANVERVPTTVGIENSYETSEYYHGNTLVRLFSDSIVTTSYATEDTQSSGINPTLGGSGNIESVQYVTAEETNTVLKVPRFPGSELDPEVRILKTQTNFVRFLGTRDTVTVSGKGVQVWTDADQGSQPGAVQFLSAQGPFSITLPTGGQIEAIGKGQTNDGNPDTWNGQVFAYIPNTGGVNTNMITLPAEVEDLLPENAVHIIQLTQNMAQDVKTNAKQTWQVTSHLTT